MRNNIGSFADTVKDIVGRFTSEQMIAIGIVLFITLVLGFMIGAISLYAAGVRKGRGKKKAAVAALKTMRDKMEEEREAALAEADKEKRGILAEKEAGSAALQETIVKLEEMERSKEAAESSRLEAERAAREAAERVRLLEENKSGYIPKLRIDSLSKEDILSYAAGLQEHLPANIYQRGDETLPDSCRVGICTFMLVYERKGTVKIVLRLHKKTAAELKKKYKLFSKAAYPKGGDWYKWILTSEVDELDVLEAAIRISYKYVYLTNYDEVTGDVDAEYVNREEAKINEEILKYKDLPDRDFMIASDAAKGEAALFLYGKKGMCDFARTLAEEYDVSVTESASDTAPATCKVDGKAFLMIYEKDGVTKIIFRASQEILADIKHKHPAVERSAFPRNAQGDWYVTFIDETFRSNDDLEYITMTACAYVHMQSEK